MKIATYFFIFLAAATTFAIGMKTMTHPITSTAAGFIAWAVSPYAYLALMAKFVSTNAAKSAVFFFSLLAGSFGVWAIVDAMFIHLDAQGGLVYVFLPVWQWTFLVLASAPLYFLNKVKNA